jgi:hypothetical protein
MAPPRILVLFPKDWDVARLHAIEASGAARIVVDGFDIYRFPSNLRVLSFDFARWVDRLERRWKGRIDGVVSHHEPFGALTAALLAERLGLPGAEPEALMRAQHKFLGREAFRRVVPEATPDYFCFRSIAEAEGPGSIGYPFFAKPVKATFSDLARDIPSRAELQRLIGFSWLERLSIKALVRPFDRALAARGIVAPPAWSMIGETIRHGRQINYDGYVLRGVPHRVGLVEERMVPGTRHFGAFFAPALLPSPIIDRCDAIVRLALGAIGFHQGFFNAEFFWDPRDDSLTLIEINPRMAAQMADLHHWTLGVDPWRMEMALAGGGDPADVPRAAPRWGAAGSMVWRTQDGRHGPEPRAGGEAALAAALPDARLMRYPKSKREFAREMKWLGSHRYGVINLPGRDRDDLVARTHLASELLGWPDPVWENWGQTPGSDPGV